MLKEKRRKFLVVNLVFAAIFLVVAGGIFFISQNASSPANLEKTGAIYKGEESQSTNKKVLIDIYGIDPEPVADIDDKTQLWLVAYDKGYLTLQAKPDDKDTARLIKKGNKELSKKPERLVGIFYNVRYSHKKHIKDYSNFMRNLLGSSDEELRKNFSFFTYVSLSDQKADQLTLTIISAIFALLGLFFAWAAFYAQKRSNQAYDQLYAEYPELNGNLESLAQEATYADDRIKVYLYKNHLIADYNAFLILDLRQTKQLYHHIFTVRYNRNSSLVAKLETGKSRTLTIKNIGKKTDDELQPLFACISQHFPHIHLGV